MSRALIAGAILGAGMVSGGLLIQSGAFREARAEQASPRLLSQVMARLARDYVDTLNEDDMYRRAASGFVKELDDPYSALLTPDRYRRLRETTTGRYAGIGIEVDQRDGFVTVIAPLAGSPADSARMRPGDRILTIDGKSTHGRSMEDIQETLRGVPGTRVKLGLERGTETPIVTLKRREIVVHPVQRSELVGSVGYIELATFSERAASELRQAIESLRARGARSLIVDLRENPGGLLEEGISVSELFLDKGSVIVSTKGRTADTDHRFTDESPQRWPDMPIVALVDSGSASAAEIVAGALQDNRRAVLVGTRTYGKGSAQSIFGISGGNALKLTTARWFTPSGQSIQRDSAKGGITPDVIVLGGRSSVLGRGAVLSEAKEPTAENREMLTNDPGVARALQLLAGVATPAELRARVASARRP